MKNKFKDPTKRRFIIQRTSTGFMVKIWKFHIYFANQSLKPRSRNSKEKHKNRLRWIRLRKLYEGKGFLDIPDSEKKANENRIANKAMLDLYMENSRNLEWLLTEVPDSVQMVTTFERNKKGKIIKAESKFYKKEIIRKEI